MKKITFLALTLSGMMLTSCGSMNALSGLNGTSSTATTTQGTSTSTSNTSSSNGNFLGSLISGATSSSSSNSTTSIIGNIISSIAPGLTTNQNTIIGTWNYSGPSVQFESDNLLSQAGGTVMADKVKNQLATYYNKVGIKAGACQFVFNKDNSMQYTINKKTYNGTYEFNSSNRTMKLTAQTGQSVTAYVSIASNAMGLTFDVSNLLKFVQNAGSISSQLSTVSSIAQMYNGMKIGFEFTK